MTPQERYWLRRGYNDALRGEPFFFDLSAARFAPAAMLPPYQQAPSIVSVYKRGRAMVHPERPRP